MFSHDAPLDILNVVGQANHVGSSGGIVHNQIDHIDQIDTNMNEWFPVWKDKFKAEYSPTSEHSIPTTPSDLCSRCNLAKSPTGQDQSSLHHGHSQHLHHTPTDACCGNFCPDIEIPRDLQDHNSDDCRHHHPRGSLLNPSSLMNLEEKPEEDFKPAALQHLQTTQPFVQAQTAYLYTFSPTGFTSSSGLSPATTQDIDSETNITTTTVTSINAEPYEHQRHMEEQYRTGRPCATHGQLVALEKTIAHTFVATRVDAPVVAHSLLVTAKSPESPVDPKSARSQFYRTFHELASYGNVRIPSLMTPNSPLEQRAVPKPGSPKGEQRQGEAEMIGDADVDARARAELRQLELGWEIEQEKREREEITRRVKGERGDEEGGEGERGKGLSVRGRE